MMKKYLFTLLFFLVCSNTVSFAQDLITTKNGEDIEARVLEISPKELKYKKYGNLEGPTYTINKRDVLMVRYENGDKDIFDYDSQLNTDVDISAGMRYREYKNYYNPRFYLRDVNDAYSPGLAGIASFFIPGLGQGVAGEWGRGIGIFAANIGLNVLVLGSAAAVNSDYNATTDEFGGDEGAAALLLGALLGQVVFDIWSICDAVRVAKIKNMYYQDLRSQRAGLDIKIEPYLASAPTLEMGGNHLSAGLSLKFNF